MKVLLAIVLVLICFRESVYAQHPNTDVKGPKVGLVLSGGGAKGFAHIGALKAIEEAGIRIDYIGGTSIGAIVGGLYASGYTATELDSIFKAVDFNTLIRDEINRSQKPHRQKEADERYAITLPFDRFKLAVPSALSKGQNTYNMLVRLLYHIDTSSFDELPIPFFCVTADVETGEEVIFEKGYLPEAISASAALPSLFRPVALDGRLFTDGGVINNYPVEALLEKDVDIIIGIDVQDNLRDRQKLKSAPDVLIQVNNFRSIEAMKAKRELTDIYIHPDISPYTLVSFDDITEIINEGEQKALLQLAALQDIAARQKNHSPQFREEIHKTQEEDSVRIDRIRIEGNARHGDDYILGKLKIKLPQYASFANIEQRINDLGQSDNFERIGYQIQTKSGKNTLGVTLKESENRQNIRLSLHYDDLYRSGALLNYSRKRLLFREDMASFDMILGENIRYHADYYIDRGFWGIGLRSAMNTFDMGLDPEIAGSFTTFPFADLNQIDIEYQDISNALYLKTLFIKTFSLELGLQHKFLNIDTETVAASVNQNDEFILERSHFYGTYGQLRFDTLDHRYFPTSGVYFDGTFDLFLFANDLNTNFSEFSIANAQLKYAKPLTPHLTLIAEGAGGFKIGGSTIGSLDFFLGGYGNTYVNSIVPFLGYDFLSLTGDGYLKAAIHLDYAFYKKHHLTFSANYANVDHNLFSSGEWLSGPAYSGYALGYGFDTFLGPLQLKYALSPELLRSEWYISLGFWF